MTERWKQCLSSISVFLIPALALVVESGYSIGAALLFLSSLFFIWGRDNPLQLSNDDFWIIGTLVSYFLILLFSIYWSGEGIRELDKPLRFFLAAISLLFLLKYPANGAALWLGLAIGAFLTGGWSLIQKIEGAARATGYTQTIQFGNLSMLMGILCLAGIGWAYQCQRGRFLWLTVMVIGSAGGVLGSLLSGSRGGWIGLPLVLWVIYKAYSSWFSQRILIGVIASCLLLAVLAVSIPQTNVLNRVQHGVDDVQRYISEGEAASSVGARLEMWRLGFQLIPEHPLLGWGSTGYVQEKARRIEQGMVDPFIGKFNHLHNEFINAAVKRGALGVIGLLILYGVPLVLFSRKLRDASSAEKPYALAGMLLPVCFLDFGLTQVFFSHNSGVMMYAFMLIVLWSFCSASGLKSSDLKFSDLKSSDL